MPVTTKSETGKNPFYMLGNAFSPEKMWETMRVGTQNAARDVLAKGGEPGTDIALFNLRNFSTMLITGKLFFAFYERERLFWFETVRDALNTLGDPRGAEVLRDMAKHLGDCKGAEEQRALALAENFERTAKQLEMAPLIPSVRDFDKIFRINQFLM